MERITELEGLAREEERQDRRLLVEFRRAQPLIDRVMMNGDVAALNRLARIAPALLRYGRFGEPTGIKREALDDLRSARASVGAANPVLVCGRTDVDVVAPLRRALEGRAGALEIPSQGRTAVAVLTSAERRLRGLRCRTAAAKLAAVRRSLS